MKAPVRGVYIFVDHSNMWGGARAVSRRKFPATDDARARISVRVLNQLLGGNKMGVMSKIVSGGVPPGMEGLWDEYRQHGYDTQRLFRDANWKEHGVDHTIIGHMWRLVAKKRSDEKTIVLASGDGRYNEFGTSFREVIEEVLLHKEHDNTNVVLASFDWPIPTGKGVRPPTNQKLKKLVSESSRGTFINLMDHADRLVYHEAE